MRQESPRRNFATPMVPRADALEQRRLLSAAVDGETFGIRGTASADVISIRLDGTTATVVDNGVQSSIDVPRRKQMRVFLDAGDDQLTATLVGRSIPATVYGGTGDDDIQFAAADERLRVYGEGGNDIVNVSRSEPTTAESLSTIAYGGDGNDLMVGSRARDQLFGEAGADSLFSGAGGSDSIYGGDGAEICRVSRRSAA